MRITILNGDPQTGLSPLTTKLTLLAVTLSTSGHQVEIIQLNSLKLHYCIGCWTCWWKTPGRCVHHDDGEMVFRAVILSDFFIFASPLIAGFTSALLKTITDRLIVLLHPYIIIREGELHHRKRYDRYPDFGLLLAKEAETDDDDLRIVYEMYKRFALNFHANIRFMKLIDEEKTEDLAHVIHHL